MKFKKLVILLIVLAALLSLSLVKKAMESQNKPEAKQEVSEAPFSGISAGFISHIEVKQGSDSVQLKKEASGEWRVEAPVQARAQKQAVEKLIEEVGALKGEERADAADLLEDFAITDDKAVHLVLKNEDKEMAHVVVSRLRHNGSQNFVRVNGFNRVLSTNTDLLSRLFLYSKEDIPSARNFADMQVVKWDQNAVTEIQWQAAGEKTPLTLKKMTVDGKNSWFLEPKKTNEEVDESQALNFLSLISNLYAMELVDSKRTDLGLDGKTAFLTATYLKAGSPAKLELILGTLNSEKKTVFLKVHPDDLIYEVSEANI